MKFFFIFFISVFLLFSCNNNENSTDSDDTDYFQTKGQTIASSGYDVSTIKTLQRAELEKYKETGDKKHLICSKYIELFLDHGNTAKQVPFVHSLLQLNHGRYGYISVSGNFNMALSYEHNSPELAMQFINTAINHELKLKKKYFLPHLYHAKGRFYYNEGKYSQAVYYFNKCMQTLKPSEKIYFASMYNNLALVADKKGKFKEAITQIQKGIRFLSTKPELNLDESIFLYTMKGNLGFYYYQMNDFSNAEKFLREEFIFYGDKKLYENSLIVSKRLFDLYHTQGNLNKEKEMVDYLTDIEPNFKNTSDKIAANEIIQNYYIQIHDITHLEKTAEKLELLNNQYDEENLKNVKEASDALNKYVVNDINEKNHHEIESQKKKSVVLVVLIGLLIIIFTISIISIINNKRKEKEIAKNKKLVWEKSKTLLEQSIQFRDEKIKNLHENLHLKMETERLFLEKIKNIKNTNIGAEELLNDLHFKIGNLIKIDKKNNNLIDESYDEQDRFLERLSIKFPSLTNKELKLCKYFKMDLSAKEISLIENIADGTIRVYKTKIKNKIGMQKDDRLSNFLKEFDQADQDKDNPSI